MPDVTDARQKVTDGGPRKCVCDVAEGVCSWCRPRRLLEEVACKQNHEGSEESAIWKGDRVEELEGKFNVLSFKMSPPCNFSFWPMSFDFPDPLETSPDRCNH